MRPTTLRSQCAAALVLLSTALSTEANDRGNQTHDPSPLLREFCFDCHGEGSKKGGIALDQLGSVKPADRKAWHAVWSNLDAQLMPPANKPQPTAQQRALLQEWVERGALGLDPAQPDPGRVTVRRLNREEYRNTVRDLTGVEFAVQEHFPPDDTGYGFDTIGDVLNLSPIHLEKYLEAAQTIVDRAFTPENAVRKTIFPEGPPPGEPAAFRAYLKGTIRLFADRAFRRPVDEPTLERLCAIADAEASFAEGVKRAMVALLASPRFIFRAEIQPEPNNPGRVVPLDEYALASRLSYFLWSSMPDPELLALAGRGELRTRLRPQLERMLNDGRSNRFVRHFVGQWLQSRDVETVPIQPRVVLGIKKQDDGDKIFSPKLRAAMREETERLFEHVLRKKLPAEELLTANYGFLNQTLAAFYGIQGVKGADFQRVEFPEGVTRRGVLGQGTFLVVTSNPTRTSPVKRGQFVLDNLLGAPAPPPPPNIPPLAGGDKLGKKSMRELMELHRSDALCASCHARMDPIGLALEDFNAIGQYRYPEQGALIDTAGQLVTGEKFQNLGELIGLLGSSRKHDFYRCLSEKLLTYAIGRGLEASDIPNIRKIVASAESQGGSLYSLLVAVVESEPFQKRRGNTENH
jgi:hypothetical protein